ncbi:MAG: hypothetical protein ACP5IO_06415 [Elusimicrobiales bacterium]
MERSKSTIFIFGSILMFSLSTLMCFWEINPFYRFYYIFAWYSYIIFVDGIIFSIKAESLILSRPKEFLHILVLSIGWWFFFEIANISLKNWNYIMLPYDKTERYLGYILSYATVLPAIFETAELIETIGIFKNAGIKKINLSLKDTTTFISVGFLMFVLSITIPSVFFPFIWVSLIGVFDPLNWKMQENSFLDDINKGDGERIYTLFIAGIVCGFMWEMFNYKAGAKWTYTLAYLNSPKLFEMPLAGYLGFGFFAMECYSFYIFINNIRRKYKKYYYPLLFISVASLSLTSIILIDKYTVKSFVLM